MGEAQTAASRRADRSAPARRSTAARDFTLAVEEEFALARPGDARAREPLRGAPGGGARHGARRAPRRRADRVRGRGAHRPLRDVRRGRRPRSRAAPAALRARRRARGASWRDRHAPVEPLAGPAHHRHAALPAERRDPPLRRLAEQHVRPARARRHPRRRPGDRRLQRAAATSCPSCSRSRRARRSSRSQHRPALGAHRDLHAHVPALRRARTRTTAGAASRTTCASSTRRARSTSTRRSGGASARISRFRRSRSASATRSPIWRRRSRSQRSSTRLTARLARAVDEGEPLPDLPHRLIEENLWRAIRYGLSGELIDLERGDVRPARAALEGLIEWMLPVAEELGA